jgi:hypothetical protein
VNNLHLVRFAGESVLAWLRLLCACLALLLLAGCEQTVYDKEHNIMYLGMFKLELETEFPDPEHRALVAAALEDQLPGWNPQPVKHLLDRPGVKYGYTPLMLAVRAQRRRSTTWLLEHGANPNYRTPDKLPNGKENPLGGRSALHYAVNVGHQSIATLLFDHGADPNLFGLVYPVFFETMNLGRGDGTLFRLFIERGADINLRHRPHGRTVLMHASTRGHCAAALRLIDLGADVHARTRVRLGSGVGRVRMNNPLEDDWMYINILAVDYNHIDLNDQNTEGKCYAQVKRALVARGVTFPQFDKRDIQTWLREKTPITPELLRRHGADDDTVRRVMKWYEDEILLPPEFRTQ